MFNIFNSEKIVHFIGVGGSGVSGLAEIMHSMGYIVQGSDKMHSQNVERLEKLGISVSIGHTPNNVGQADVVVYSSAIKSDNPELLYANQHKIPALTRAEMLSQIIRFKKSVIVSGSHGKTTVTSLCAAILEMASFFPTIVNGGIINSYQTNAKLGTGDWAVVESDESDGSFLHFSPTISIITNIDYEHINHYGSFENLKKAFKNFIKTTPFYGACIVCIDDINIQEIIKDIMDRKIITYSINNEDAMYRAVNIRKTAGNTTFDVIIKNGTQKLIQDISIPMLGDHNILNSLSAIAMSQELNIDIETVKTTLHSFMGVNRRFTHVGEIQGVQIIDDYAHHPTEIESVLNSAYQSSAKKVAIVCQPHRFTRLNNLFTQFVDILSKPDIRIITPVYKADDSEEGLKNSTDLFEALKHIPNTFFANDETELNDLIMNLIKTKDLNQEDIILFVGAGSISKWAHEIWERNNA